MMTVIESGDYENTRLRLMQDPVVIAMAKGLENEPRSQLCWDDGSPKFDFMMSANAEYRKRGGKDGGHIGAIAEALLRLI
jgi:hypothetical protein